MDRIRELVGNVIDSGYDDTGEHIIEILTRSEDGIKVVVRDDAVRTFEADDMKRSTSLGMNAYYMTF